MAAVTRAGARQVLLAAGLLLLLQVGFFAALVASQALPDGVIIDRLATAVENETYGPQRMPDRMGGQGVTFTDCVELGTGLGAEPGESTIRQAARMPRLGSCTVGQEQVLALAAGEQVEGAEYFRYWAGYVTVTRPLIALVGVDGLRMAVGGGLVLALVLAWRSLSTALGAGAAAALLIPGLVATNLTALPVVGFSHAISTAVGLLGLAAIAHAGKAGTVPALRWVMIAASAYCFVDLLTTPSMWWALSAFVVAAGAWVRTQSPKQTWTAVLAAGAIWPAAFGLTWVARWLLSLAVLGPDHVLEQILGKVTQRSAGGERNPVPSPVAGIEENWRLWWEQVPTSGVVLVLGLVAAVVALALALRRHGAGGLAAFAGLALPVLVIPAWYLVLNEHSWVHSSFTYRPIPFGVGIAIASAFLLWRSRPPTEGEKATRPAS